MTEIHPIDRLFQRLDRFGPYPPGVVPVPARIPGIAFFPGGAGLWDVEPGKPLPPMPTGGVMVLGHNFDSIAGFAYSLHHAGENLNGPMWRGTLDLIDRAGIPRRRCFFTNAYMGLIDGPSAVGAFPGRRDSGFVGCCRDLLREQITAQQPRLILTLGLPVLGVLAPLAPELQRAWSGVKSFSELDDHDHGFVHPVQFKDVAHAVAVVALTHPAYRPANVKRRRYQGHEGDAAEMEMIAEAICTSGVVETGRDGHAPDRQEAVGGRRR